MADANHRALRLDSRQPRMLRSRQPIQGALRYAIAHVEVVDVSASDDIPFSMLDILLV